MSRLVRGLEDLVKAVLPDPVVERIRAHRHEANARRYEAGVRRQARDEWRATLRHWRVQAKALGPAGPSSGRTLVFPSDPRAIVGSRGDDAMIAAVVQAVRSASPDAAIDVLCEDDGRDIVSRLGLTPVTLGAQRDFPAEIAGLLRERGYEAYIGIGADIIDGRFELRIPALMLIAADLAARAGVRASILGCSFGESPRPELKAVYARLDPRVRVNVRDPVSLRRVQAFAPVNAVGVADAAFTLQPGRPDPAALAWVERQRANRRSVIGINIHPMLVRDADPAWVEAMVAATAQALQDVARRRGVACLLLPHDYRDGFGDVGCLRRLHEVLAAAGQVDSHFVDGEHGAADIKALAGRLDAVITGRMHLAIAALGMGVPVLTLTYHDKFEGLYGHFGLPRSLLLPPSVFDDPSGLARHIDGFIETLPALARAIGARLPEVTKLAGKNFERW